MPPIKIEITKEMVSRVNEFSENVLQETFDRFRKDNLTRFERIFVGKLGELCFSNYLSELGIPHDISMMFAIFPGTTNVDPFDFVVPTTEETIDVKTAYKPFHSRILIPYGESGQWTQMPKSYYVGIKLERILNDRGHLDFSINRNPYADLYGYISRRDTAWHGPQDFGEGPCMWAYLRDLKPIDILVQMMSS